MYGIPTYIYHKNQQHVGKYTIHGSNGNSGYAWDLGNAFKKLCWVPAQTLENHEDNESCQVGSLHTNE